MSTKAPSEWHRQHAKRSDVPRDGISPSGVRPKGGPHASANVRRCTRCILPETYPGISFDEKGACNHCLAYRDTTPRGEAALQTLIEPYREQATCILALSGGRDSAFAAHYVVKSLGLRPLLYTFDNGFMPDEITENTANTARRLGLDHTTVKSKHLTANVRHVLSCWMHHPSPATIGLLCGGCRTGYEKGLTQTVHNHQTSADCGALIITGAGEPGGGHSFAEALLASRERSYQRGGSQPPLCMQCSLCIQVWWGVLFPLPVQQPALQNNDRTSFSLHRVE